MRWNSQTSVSRAEPAADKVKTTRPGILACGLTMGVLSASAIFFTLHGQLNADEGFYLLASKLVREGYRPYRDFGFTQGPILPYVNVPWLELFGYTLDGQRLTSLVWLLAGLSVAAFWLKRTHSWLTATWFLIILVGAPAWAGYMVKGKTYAFGSLCVLLGGWALLSPSRLLVRWTVFLLAAALGVGARFPLAGFFLPAGLGLLALTPGWRGRLLAIVTTLGLAGGLVGWAAAGAWSNLLFWTIQFHEQALFEFRLAKRLGDALRYAPAIWPLALLLAVLCIRQRNVRSGWVLLSLLVAVVVNISARSTYAEYLMPFVATFALVAAPVVGDFFVGRKWPVRLMACAVLAGVGWLWPLERTPDILYTASEAEAFLRANVPAGSQVAGSMPEIGVAAGMKIPLPLVMGKFAFTEDFSDELAASRLMVTAPKLIEIIGDPSTAALVMSSFSSWNFFWSVPSYRRVTPRAENAIRGAINEHFFVGFMNHDYLIFLRKPTAAVPTEK